MKYFCINLDRRSDRWENVSNIFLQHSLDVVRWSAIDCKTHNISGPRAAKLSHIELLKFCKNANIDQVIIFEDDVILCHNFIDKLNTIIEKLPNDWKAVSLHSFKAKTTIINSYIVKLLSKMHGAHAMLLNANGINEVLESDHRRCLEDIYYNSVDNFYGVSLDHTLVFQNGIDSDIPETSALSEYRKFYEKYRDLHS